MGRAGGTGSAGLGACGGGDGDNATGSYAANGVIRSAVVVVRTDATRQPIDAAPSPDGSVIYYLATGDPGPAVFRVPGGGGDVSTVLEGAPLTQPTVIAVATDGSRVDVADRYGTLVVSAIDTATQSDQLLLLDLGSGKTSVTTKVIGTNKSSSGGVHRAYSADVLAWADVQRSGRGYRVEP